MIWFTKTLIHTHKNRLRHFQTTWLLNTIRIPQWQPLWWCLSSSGRCFWWSCRCSDQLWNGTRRVAIENGWFFKESKLNNKIKISINVTLSQIYKQAFYKYIPYHIMSKLTLISPPLSHLGQLIIPLHHPHIGSLWLWSHWTSGFFALGNTRPKFVVHFQNGFTVFGGQVSGYWGATFGG